MSAVYLGRRVDAGEGGDHVVALKIARHEIRMNERMLHMFLEEGKLLARLVHPNIVRTLEVGGDAEQDFIAMELMLGKTFAAIQEALSARDVRISHDIAAWTAARIADALHYAHELADESGHPLALVHRDVNPANVFATFGGEVKLFDFGLAKVTAGDASGSHLIAGKLSYLSPEQIMQMPLDRRSDVFSLGTTLWELLTGRRLFRRPSDLDTVRAVQLGPIPDPRTVAPEVPEELARITKTALERNREHRYPTAASLARELDTFVLSQTTSSDVELRLAQLVDALFPGEQKRQAGWVKPVMGASIRPSTGPAGPVSVAAARMASGRPPHSQSPPRRSLSPMTTTAVMPNAPHHDGRGSSPSVPDATSSSALALAPSGSAAGLSSRPSLPGSQPQIPPSRPSAPQTRRSPNAPPLPPGSSPPDTVRHLLDLSPRESVPFLEADAFFETDSTSDGALHDGDPAAAPPTVETAAPFPSRPPSIPPPPTAHRGGPSVPPPPLPNRASHRPRQGSPDPGKPPRPESISPPPASATEISSFDPASRTELDAMPEPVPESDRLRRRIDAAAAKVPPPATTPATAFGRPKRPPVPLPSRTKVAGAAKDAPVATTSSPPRPGPTPRKTSKGGAPDSDTQIDGAPPPRKTPLR